MDSEGTIPPAYVARARICKPCKEPRNRFPAWRAGTATLFVVLARLGAAKSILRNRFLDSINFHKHGRQRTGTTTLFLNNCVCAGRFPDPTSLFLPTSFCM
jgi:hypothetical protein